MGTILALTRISIFRGSSMVEQEAVNFKVVGSSPTHGAKEYY